MLSLSANARELSFPNLPRGTDAGSIHPTMAELRYERLASALANATFRFTVGCPERAASVGDVDEIAAKPSTFPRFYIRDSVREPQIVRPSLVASLYDNFGNASSGDPDRDEQMSVSSPMGPLTPLSKRVEHVAPATFSPKQGGSHQEPCIDIPKTKTKKRARQKTQRRREQCRVNQARYRAKMKRLKLDAAMRGGSSSDESSSSSMATKLITSPPKKLRARVKTERRMQQCRINQARYRSKQRARELELEKSIQRLKAEIKQLESKRVLLADEGLPIAL